jgi:hypothetical protein
MNGSFIWCSSIFRILFKGYLKNDGQKRTAYCIDSQINRATDVSFGHFTSKYCNNNGLFSEGSIQDGFILHTDFN